MSNGYGDTPPIDFGDSKPEEESNSLPSDGTPVPNTADNAPQVETNEESTPDVDLSFMSDEASPSSDTGDFDAYELEEDDEGGMSPTVKLLAGGLVAVAVGVLGYNMMFSGNDGGNVDSLNIGQQSSSDDSGKYADGDSSVKRPKVIIRDYENQEQFNEENLTDVTKQIVDQAEDFTDNALQAPTIISEETGGKVTSNGVVLIEEKTLKHSETLLHEVDRAVTTTNQTLIEGRKSLGQDLNSRLDKFAVETGVVVSQGGKHADWAQRDSTVEDEQREDASPSSGRVMIYGGGVATTDRTYMPSKDADGNVISTNPQKGNGETSNTSSFVSKLTGAAEDATDAAKGAATKAIIKGAAGGLLGQ